MTRAAEQRVTRLLRAGIGRRHRVHLRHGLGVTRGSHQSKRKHHVQLTLITLRSGLREIAVVCRCDLREVRRASICA